MIPYSPHLPSEGRRHRCDRDCKREPIAGAETPSPPPTMSQGCKGMEHRVLQKVPDVAGQVGKGLEEEIGKWQGEVFPFDS